jgi:hypothetical protein
LGKNAPQGASRLSAPCFECSNGIIRKGRFLCSGGGWRDKRGGACVFESFCSGVTTLTIMSRSSQHNSDYQYFPETRELIWRGQRYRCIASGNDLIVDLSADNGPIVSVEPRFESMGVEYVQIFFNNKTYTGAQIKSSFDVTRAFDLIINYIDKYNGNVVPHNFNFCFASIIYTKETMTAAIAKTYTAFPGARKMGLPFKAAVEKYLQLKYGARVGRDLTKAEIFNDDRKLYQAMDNYRKQFGKVPFDIPSVQDIARDRLEHVARVGVENASRLDRKAAHKLARRLTESAEKIPGRSRKDATHRVRGPSI